MVSMTELAGEPHTLLRASDDWQLFERSRTRYAVTGDWYTLEGPFVEPEVGPVLVSGGAGHNSIVTGPDGEDRIVYHRWDEGRERRQMWIERLVWDSRPRAAGA
jgi:hypothetical protein